MDGAAGVVAGAPVLGAERVMRALTVLTAALTTGIVLTVLAAWGLA